MDTHTIELKEITFADASGTTDLALRYPVYGNLFREAAAGPHRSRLQLEPAFQFLDSGDDGIYEFIFELTAEENVFFVRGADGAPAHREAAGRPMPCVQSLDFPDPGDLRSCRVRVVPTAWGESRVVTLRLFCNRDSGSGGYDAHDGVSLSLVGPDSGASRMRQGTTPPPVGPQLEIGAQIVIRRGSAVPRYDLYQPSFLSALPDALCLEPALRFSEHRAAAILKVRLDSRNARFEQPGAGSDDEAQLKTDGGGAAPAALSRLVCGGDERSARFAWSPGPEAMPPASLVFGFSLGVEVRAEDGPNSAARGDVDPILFNDPPPGGR